MSEESSGGAWAVFGKLSAALAAISTIVGIYLAINPSRPELVAKCTQYSYTLPPDLISTIEDVRREESSEAIQEQLQLYWSDKVRPKNFSVSEISQHLSKASFEF